ncbi:MAG: hypothetical protein CMP38_04505 [Rickettsiales bacterium]|nr:hypothetical protein [Rickettsiales bacterium]
MYNNKFVNSLSESIYAGNSTAVNNLPSWLLKSDFSRNNTDLIATSPDGDQLTLIDYFINFELPNLYTDNGLQLKGSAVNYLAGPLAKGQYAQSTDVTVLSIGEVSTVSGTVKATRLDGTITNLNVGDPVFQGDTIETEGSGAVGLVFLDKTTFSLSDGGKMILDELVFDAATATGSMVVNMVEGAFSFISGEIAKTGPDAMTLETPVVTMGIRGTTVAGKAAVEGNENSFTLLQDADGGVGQISVSNDGGTQVLSQVGATTSVSSFTTAPPAPIILSAAQIQANYGTALNVLPPTPAVAPQPQTAPPPQEETQEEEAQEEEASEEEVEEEVNEEQVAEEGSEDGEGEGEEGQLEGEGEEGPPEGEEGAISESDGDSLASDEAASGPPEGETSSAAEEPGTSEEQVAAAEAFDTALAAGSSPEQAMAEAAEVAGLEGPEQANSIESNPNNPNSLSNPMSGNANPILAPINAIIASAPGSYTGMTPVSMGPADIISGPAGSAGILGGPLGAGTIDLLVSPIGAGLGDIYSQTEVEVFQESFFFDDPSLYNVNIEEEPETTEINSFYINGASDFGRIISDYSLSQTLTINFTFDEPVSTHSVTRSDFYEYTSTASTSSLSWDSKPSTTAQTVNETEPNGTFGSAQVIARSRFKIATNSDVGDDSIPWVKIQGGYINNGIDIFKVDLQAGETLTVDIDYGDSYSIDFNSYVTMWNQALSSVVAENDDSAISLGGAGSSGTEDSYFTYTTSTTESFYLLVEDAPRNNNSSTRGDFVLNLSISPTSSSTGLGTSSTTSVGGDNKLPYLFNFTENTNNYNTKSFKSDIVSSIKYTDSTSGTGSEVFLMVGDGTNSAIWLWDDLSEGYGISDNELTLVATLPNFDNDTLTGSEIVFGTI